MTLLALLLTALFTLEALRARAQLSALATLDSADPGEPDATDAPELQALVLEGVELGPATRRAAEAHARAAGLAVLDLVPCALPALDALELARCTDFARYRSDRLARGRTALHATLFDADVAQRSGEKGGALRDPAAFAASAVRLKRYAAAATDLVVAPSLQALRRPQRGRERAVARELLGEVPPLVLARPLLLIAGLALTLALPGSRLWGALALAAFHLQPLLALAGGPLRPPDLGRAVLLRLPLELARGLALLRGGQGEGDPREQARPVYERLLVDGTGAFFEARRESCPLCGSRALAVHLRCRDGLQCKPGRFTLERCAECAHLFQNPRLSEEGLAFYYRDFYTGLGEAGMDAVFCQHARFYRARAELVRGSVVPRRWLDVGAGHGHFCATAREVWPDTRFDGVDWGEPVEEAERRGWVDRGLRGQLLELAPGLAGTYDVVSMSHYLEHTRDPEAEIAAAAGALAPGGCLLVEVPDPECALAPLLGRWWYAWFQPQHQHFLSAANLERLLRAQRLEPLVWQRDEPGLGGDFVFAVIFLLRRLSPPLDLPWRPRATPVTRAAHALVWGLGVVPLVAAAIADRALAPFARRLGTSNAYRVLARQPVVPTGADSPATPGVPAA